MDPRCAMTRNRRLAAGAEAQLTGSLRSVRAAAGPGNLHLINGLSMLIAANAPVLQSRRIFRH